MYDIHSHILYGVDDGAACIEESVEMAAQAAAAGTEVMIATPHFIEGLYIGAREDNLKRLSRLIDEINKIGIKMEIYLGSEVLITPELPKLVRVREISTLNDSRYVLVELPFFDIPSYTERVLLNLEMEGFKAVLAHPERNEQINSNPDILYGFIKEGALVQMNISSIEGLYGKKVKKAAKKMLECRMVHFVGTDIHSAGKEPAGVNDIVEMLKAYCPDQVHSLLWDNPKSIITDEPLKIDEPHRIRDR